MPLLQTPFAIGMNVLNVLVFALILYGVVIHSRRTLHVRVMTTAFILDLLIVLAIELNRHAIAQAIGPASGLMRFHIAVSVAALVLWVCQVITGRQILRGKPRLRRHKAQAWAFLICRAANVVTAFIVAA